VGRPNATVLAAEGPYAYPEDVQITPLYPKPCVLVVDDEFTPRSIVCRMVRNTGYPVEAAKDRVDALR
jgi:hypothetical protein